MSVCIWKTRELIKQNQKKYSYIHMYTGMSQGAYILVYQFVVTYLLSSGNMKFSGNRSCKAKPKKTIVVSTTYGKDIANTTYGKGIS
jgi:hypothetical protein